MKNLSRPKAALEANGAEFVSNEECDKLKAEKKAAGAAWSCFFRASLTLLCDAEYKATRTLCMSWRDNYCDAKHYQEAQLKCPGRQLSEVRSSELNLFLKPEPGCFRQVPSEIVIYNCSGEFISDIHFYCPWGLLLKSRALKQCKLCLMVWKLELILNKSLVVMILKFQYLLL